MLGNWGRLCPFDMIFSANGSVFHAEHDPLLRTTYFLSKTRVLRVRKRCSTLKLKARYKEALHGTERRVLVAAIAAAIAAAIGAAIGAATFGVYI